MSSPLSIHRQRIDRFVRLDRSRLSSLTRSGMPAGLRLGGAALQFVVTILIARILGPGAAGIYFFWIAILMETGQVATYGLDRIALREVPRLREHDGAMTAFLAPLRFTALALALLAGCGLSLYAYVFQQSQGWPAWWYFLPPLCCAGVALSMINSDAVTGLGRPLLAVLYRHTLIVLTVLSVVLVAQNVLTPEIALLGYTGGFLLAGFGALYGPGFFGTGPPIRLPSKPDLKTHFSSGTPVFASSLFTSLCTMIPLTLLERTHPSEEIAYVSTAFRIFVLIDVLAKAVHSLLMPELSRAAHEGEVQALFHTFLSAIGRGLALLILPIAGIALFAGEVMAVFGPSFVEGSPILRILMAVALISLAMGPAHQLLLMVGKTRHMALFSLVHLGFTGTLSIVLVPSLGPVGLALVIGGGMLLEKALFLWFSLRTARRTSPQPQPGGSR